MSKLFEAVDRYFDQALMEEELWGIHKRSSASGNETTITTNGKYVAFASKDEASKCRQALDDEGGNINNFISYTLVDLSNEDPADCQIFNTYEEYKEASDNEVKAKIAKDDEAHAKLATIRDEVKAQIANDLTAAGFNIYNIGEHDSLPDHKSPEDVTVRSSIYCYIILDVGVSSNGNSYGSIQMKVSEDGSISSDDLFTHNEPYSKCKNYMLKRVKELSDKSKQN